MAELETFWKVLLAIAAAIVSLGGALAVFERYSDRAKMSRAKIAEQVGRHEQRLDRDHKRLSELEESNRLIMRGVMSLMSHELDGNHTNQLEKVRNDMNDYLVNR